MKNTGILNAISEQVLKAMKPAQVMLAKQCWAEPFGAQDEETTGPTNPVVI